MKHGIKQKQSEFERNAKKILGFERFWSKIREIEKKIASQPIARKKWEISHCEKDS